MDRKIKKMIEARREVVEQYYDLPPDEQRKAEEFFARMERCGDRCRDLTEFRTLFTTQTMYREYNLMLMEFSAYVKTNTD
ncbi:MAG: hypothetical protein LBU98_01095 [Alistipes sp.]|jgi:hypothetical protein|nr:hypothetical protein [Alistipes sp.]